ncbi:MAG TPA: polysaccharide biosynthesis C-terminal domain-containing protein, partial [Ktedonosporobacter sp.]|nr:polysaccharide biosynthesis C-terminal domain-containing protein [Ktedonosporobacter sp.]
MQKIKLRPLRLVRLQTDQLAAYAPTMEGLEVRERNSSPGIYTHGPQPLPGTPEPLQQIVPDTDLPQIESEARHLLQRTPHSYVFNQVYGLWFFISSFLLTFIITHNVSTEQYGVYAIVSTAFNTVLYIVAFGLEDATTTYFPRIFAEHGKAAAARFTRQLFTIRLAVLILSAALLLFALPGLSTLITMLPIPGTMATAATLRDPILLAHLIPMVIFMIGNSIGSLLTAVCAALMRMQRVFVIGSLTQLCILILGFVVLKIGWQVDGVIWLLAIISLFNAAAFVLWLSPFLFTFGSTYRQPLKPVIQLGFSAWITNLVSGALLKQISLILLGVFAVSLTDRGYFNLSFQLADAANYLLVAGFGGVGGAALAAAFVGLNYDRLARTWQALIKIETLLAAPGLIFCLFNAQNVAHALYGSSYDPVGPLLIIFLFFNLLTRILGTTIHLSTLYVIGKPRLVVFSLLLGIVVSILSGILLIPHFGPAGALVADGLARTVTGALLLFFSLRYLPGKYALSLLSFTSRFLLALTLAAL